jgi:uncharacterized protein (TIGR03086 family)
MSALMTPDLLERAFSNTRGIVAVVTPDQLDAPTPCVSWSVRDIINHLVAATFWFAGAVTTGTGPPVADDDFSSGDYLATYDDGIAQSLAAFRAPGALEQTLNLHFGPLPAATFLALATNDAFAHGWDIARATGQPTDIDPELATQLLPAARAWIRPEGRGADRAMPFGPERDAPPGASAADQLAAFLGRTV